MFDPKFENISFVQKVDYIFYLHLKQNMFDQMKEFETKSRRESHFDG
jgi:hypothetical protein